MDSIPNIDWSGFTWPVSDTCTCLCGQIFRSHAKATYSEKGRMGIWSKDPCPNCGEHRLEKVESDPERWTL